MPTLITAGDASNGVVVTSSNDNALTIQTGPNGGKVNAIALASDGTATFLKVPANATAQSMVRLNTANGYGSSSTMIRRFTNTVTNQGSDITYADSATLGATFTINTAGVYAITYIDQFTAGGWAGISRNSASLTTAIQSLSVTEILAINYNNIANVTTFNSWCGYLSAGDVIRAHAAAAATGTQTNAVHFTITRVA